MFTDNIDFKTLKNSAAVKGLFYRGVVEDINDPEKLDRVRVRVFGVHTMEIEGESRIKTEELPWAEVISTSVFGTSTGIGVSFTPINGTWVWLFFENNDFQKPVIIGTTKGFVTQKQTNIGFTDPDGIYPLSDRLQESDTNRLHRNEKYQETALSKERDPELEESVPYTTDGISTSGTWDMPKELNTKSIYPDNTVIETKTGHIIEIDDTPGNERIHIFHTSGSFTEFRPDGSVSTKVHKDDYNVIYGDAHKLVKGNKIETTMKDNNKSVFGNDNSTISGNQTESISGNQTIDIDGTQSETIGGTSTKVSGGAQTYTAPTIFLN